MAKRKKRKYRYPSQHAYLRVSDRAHLEMWGFHRDDGQYWVARLSRPSIDLWSMMLPRDYLEIAKDYGLGRLAMGILKSLAAKATGITTAQGKPDPVSKKKYPALVELLTAAVGDDGEARELSSITVKWQDGGFKAGIHEPNLSMSLWAAGETLEGVLEALERRINADDADWRRWNDKQAKIGQKRK